MGRANKKRRQTPVKVAIVYPTWKVRGVPTPYEKLWVCDGCGYAQWTQHGINVRQCKCNLRMREATDAEYVSGRAAIQEIIG
jgi:hypothetical protein